MAVIKFDLKFKKWIVMLEQNVMYMYKVLTVQALFDVIRLFPFVYLPKFQLMR